MILYYIHDPMCSWCWGFKPILTKLQQTLPKEIQIEYLLGGLAIDTQTPMSEEMKLQIKSTWERIEKAIPGTEFNYNFWINNEPRRSTYPACRAVLAAKRQGLHKDKDMLNAIQKAYYLDALNPSNMDVLETLADNIGLNTDQFKKDTCSDEVNTTLLDEIKFTRYIGASSFPSLFLEKEDRHYPIVLDYNNSDVILEHIKSFI